MWVFTVSLWGYVCVFVWVGVRVSQCVCVCVGRCVCLGICVHACMCVCKNVTVCVSVCCWFSTRGVARAQVCLCHGLSSSSHVDGGGCGFGGCMMCCDSGSQSWQAVTAWHHIAKLPEEEGSARQPSQEVLIGATRLAFAH